MGEKNVSKSGGRESPSLAACSQSAWSLFLGGNTMPFDAGAELRACQAQQAGGLGLVLAGARESLKNHAPLRLLQRSPYGCGSRGGRGSCVARCGQAQRQMLGGDDASFAENHGPLDRIAQLAHVARPRV